MGHNILALSLGMGALPSFLERHSEPSTILFVPTAGEVYEDRYFVDSDRKRLESLGYSLLDWSFSESRTDRSEAQIAGAEAIYVTGGNTFFLLQQVRRNDWVEPLLQYLLSGKPYVGASAGCVVLCPSLEAVTEIDDPGTAPHLESFDSLSVVNEMILPHYGKEKYLPVYEAAKREFGDRYPIRFLRDDEALTYENGDVVGTLMTSDIIFPDL